MENRTNPVLATVAPISGVAREVTATIVVHPAGRERARAAGGVRATGPDRAVAAPPSDLSCAPASPASAHATASGDRLGSEDGSLVTEYGLLAVVAATLAGAVMSWASNGALVTLFNALLRQARSLVGA